MKRIPTTPLLMSLAVALCPAVVANENPAQQAAAEAPAEKQPEPEVIAGLQKHIETMNEAVSKARTEATDAAKQRDAARQEALAVREAKQKLEGQLGGLKKQLETTGREVGQWKEKAAALEKKLGAGEEAYAKLGTFRDEMTAALEEFAVLKTDLANVRGELQAPAERVALKKEIAGLEKAKGELAGKLDAEAKAHAESKSLVGNLRKSLDELKASAKAQFELLARTQRERDALGKEAARLRESKDAAERDLASARGELDQTQQMLAMLQKDAAELRATMEPLAAGIQEAKDQAAKATVAIREASAARETAERDAAQVKSQLQVVNARLAEALRAQDGLRAEVTAKSTEIAGLRKKVEDMEATTAMPAENEKAKSAGL